MAIKPRLVVRGRTNDPIARLQTSERAESQPARFSHGMWAIVLFISSEAMFFAALFTTYFYLRTSLPEWHPALGHKPGWEGLPLINTVILVASSVTMQIAVMAVKKDDRRMLKTMLTVTFVLGAVFLLGQGYEYTRLGFVPVDGIFAAVFYTLTGFHGLHVLGGVLFIGYCLLRALKGQFSGRRHLAVEAASMYWHFVDVVWIGLFFTIYVIG